MDLDLEINDATEPTVVREITEEDLTVLKSAPVAPATSRLSKIRDTHHGLARALASGMKEGEAAERNGYSLTRLSYLKNDPAFQQLLAFYRGKVDEVYTDLHTRMASFSVDIIDELRERFEEKPEDMSVSFLHSMLETFADRTGHGPRTTQVNVNVDLASRLDAARRRAGLVELDLDSTTRGEGDVVPSVSLPLLLEDLDIS